ncbi:MAG: hypothetical protein SCABRO_02198 [Candidatus Scalindua brodae]|uniref:DUF2231 domain-containing protein n=1 Tax=Candidatus Scalindua brodae TaxID=237368 RepID=A0A0B0EG10_9BACT|nr:MAG: hypothetical protein SCABRO_02198 [Candidatus Scalindua brodae]
MKLTMRTSLVEILKKIFPEKTKLKIKLFEIPFHAIAVHFPTALYPVAIIFLFLALIFDRDSFRNTYFYLMIIAAFFTPISHFTGILEWKNKYRGAKTHIFINKIRFSLILSAVGAICVIWYWFSPDMLNYTGIYNILFIILNISTIPLIIYLGHLGGKLVYGLPR